MDPLINVDSQNILPLGCLLSKTMKLVVCFPFSGCSGKRLKTLMLMYTVITEI